MRGKSWKMKHRGETNFYLCEINRDMTCRNGFLCVPGAISVTLFEFHVKPFLLGALMVRIGIFATHAIAGNCLNGTGIVEKIVFSMTLLRIRFLVFMNWANKFSRFVQFGTDKDCYCGTIGCRRKLGVKPNKPKMPSSEAALKLVACQVAASSPKVKAMLFGRNVYQNGALHGGMDLLRWNSNNCIGEVVRILHPEPKRHSESACLQIPAGGPGSFGIIKRFGNFSKTQSIMFEDGSAELIDISKEEWEFCSFIFWALPLQIRRNTTTAHLKEFHLKRTIKWAHGAIHFFTTLQRGSTTLEVVGRGTFQQKLGDCVHYPNVD
ncbi:hypothetical protein Cgig2_009948 [Carnegiea gigantea]|uniref:Post-SET domain-containing protein n=1 Tax=Carnegiea gigantea TaxID=171969 RepID=A0A9Q1GY55_9CARY|nr:hypothetical protein Cgig2_009948 [Carnegiea gigantea]